MEIGKTSPADLHNEKERSPLQVRFLKAGFHLCAGKAQRLAQGICQPSALFKGHVSGSRALSMPLMRRFNDGRCVGELLLSSELSCDTVAGLWSEGVCREHPCFTRQRCLVSTGNRGQLPNRPRVPMFLLPLCVNI